YGTRASRVAAFPLLFLLWMVPLPEFALDKFITLLQHGSAEVAHGLFRLTGVPVFRDGLVFSLPGIDIEVAKVCSGIRSSLALIITGLLAGYLFLRTSRSRLALVTALFPLLIVKNGLRIVTLTLLAVYVDRGFLTGNLHRKGGIVFFAIALALLALLLRYLQKVEANTKQGERLRLSKRSEAGLLRG
ncbi:MAG: exosortase/archaeosortase family protein, partial [bacterium]